VTFYAFRCAACGLDVAACRAVPLTPRDRVAHDNAARWRRLLTRDSVGLYAPPLVTDACGGTIPSTDPRLPAPPEAWRASPSPAPSR
jgi:hypothetical protein